MDEPERKPVKSEEDNNNQETLHLLNIFPDLIWCLILDKLSNVPDYFKLCKSFPASHKLLSGHRTKVLFGDVVKIMVRRLENGEGNQEHNMQLPNLVSLRRVCESWKRDVDSNLQNLTFNYKFSTEYKLPRSQFEKDIDHNYGYRFKDVEDYEEFQHHFESTHEATGVNPFITRRIIISIELDRRTARDPQLDLLSSTCLDMLRIYGKHVWYLYFEAGMTESIAGVRPVRIFNLLKNILHNLPNLRVLRIEPPLNQIVEYDVHQISGDGNPVIPSVNKYERYNLTMQNTYRRSEPIVANRQEQQRRAPGTHNIVHSFFNQLLAVKTGQIPRVPAAVNNPPGNPRRHELPEENCAVPVLPYLRFVDQGKMSFDSFMEIIRPNVQSLTQLGLALTSREECVRFWDLPLNLTKLEISLWELDMPWIEIFPLLHIYCTNLESLHIYLPKPEIVCPLGLPKLQVLYLLLDSAVPLDFLLGMSYNLEELYVKIGRMNQLESGQVQREERSVLFYRHLGQLTNSNIWTEFPKLRIVRACPHAEIENMTPVWQCTVEEWKNRNVN